jgi:antitoxin component YwqK of YwqJK toxin-antitoxin module
MVKPLEPVPQIDHYATGTPKSTGFILDGVMHGDWQFFRLDGSLMRSGTFDRGRQVGVWRTFDRTGHLVKETTFREH